MSTQNHESSAPTKGANLIYGDKTAPDVLTFRFGKQMVYVTPVDNYEAALDMAQSVFADHLANADRSRIHFTVNVFVHNSKQVVRIAPTAWLPVMCNLTKYEVVDVHVAPQAPPPEYLATEGVTLEVDEKNAKRLSPRPRSATSSRQPSPVGDENGKKKWKIF